jgi:hypothetical protein
LIGSLLLVLGILVWPLGWFVLPLVGIEVRNVPDLLALHLLGVVPGSYLRGSRLFGSPIPDRIRAEREGDRADGPPRWR